MTSISLLAHPSRMIPIAGLLIAFVLLAGCGGGGGGASEPPPPAGQTPPPPSTPADIEGVAMPASVAVVTATNAQ